MEPEIPSPDAASQPTLPPKDPANETRYISGFWRRLSAFCLDIVILALLLAYPAYRWMFFFLSNSGWTLAVGFTMAFIYFVLLNSRIGGGQTLGKRLLRIRVVDIRGETISTGRSAMRFLAFATPFFAEKVQFPCDGGYCALTVMMSWIFTAWEVVIAYFFIFNRRTGQSLHDLATGTYVIETALWPTRDLQPAVAASEFVSQSTPPYVTSQKIWREHWVILGAVLLVALVLGISSLSNFLSTGTYSEMAQIQQAVLRSGKARTVAVKMTIGKFTGDHTPKRLEVTFVPAREAADEAKQAAEIAAIVLETSPNALGADFLDIGKMRVADFGFFHITANKSIRRTPEEWKKIILATGAAREGHARLDWWRIPASGDLLAERRGEPSGGRQG